MNITVDINGPSQVAIVESDDILIGDVQAALDLMASVRYTAGCDKMLIHKNNIVEEFFDLKTKLAGDILQKYTNYQVKIAIVGDYDGYDSKSLKDFIYECNQGNSIFFLKDRQAALQALHSAV
ncbi:DUF4180 domain-containing protein [Paenibacillus sp. GCM10023248]|uniref:DUF4180 domain-containing protein n=1 Tax=unclassified Paenibacillus TaxID=185978 RepID=UPI0023782859|nr:DUF4180 domain-containing protein [Paenibacillus sp. MAHUQ-63]MDD9270779.1 DUF4180 domain-containing protein [Paenibacillus sp. MAHUQ-63]